MDFYNFFLEADDEEEKKKKDKESEDDDKKDKDDEEEKYNDLIDSDDKKEIEDSEPESEDEEDSSKDSDDEYNDLMDDDGKESLDDEDEDPSDSPDSYNVLVIAPGSKESYESDSIFSKCAKLAYVYSIVANNMQHVHIHCRGRQFEFLHRITQELLYHFNSCIDKFLELAAQSSSTKVDNLSNASNYVSDIEKLTETDYDYNDALAAISSNLSSAITYIKDTYSAARNSDRTDILSILDNELGYINHQLNYYLARSVDVPTNVESTVESYNALF